MKEHPILFSAEMVRAILSGKKTMTRRTKGLEFVNKDPDNWTSNIFQRDVAIQCKKVIDSSRCPYGKVGDLLWVKETWGVCEKLWADYGWEFQGLISFSTKSSKNDLVTSGMNVIRQVIYAADGYERTVGYEPGFKPSIFMPRWASRITLRIKSIRVERVQDITEADVRLEGGPPSHPSIDVVSREFGYKNFAISWFAQLWDSINAKRGYSWESNPWVWVIEFERVTE